MPPTPSHRIAKGLGVIALIGWSVAVAAQRGPMPSPDATPVAEAFFQNIQVLKSVPVDEFLASMGFISNALAVNCTYCHLGDGGGGWEEYARDNDKKQIARRMITMMNAINQTHFGGRRVVTCVSCHNGAIRPKATTNMSVYYNVAVTDELDTIVGQAPGSPSADEVLDKYIEAVGGAERLAALTSWVARGTYLGYGDAEAQPVEIFARAPDQRTQIVHTLSGDTTTTYDGRAGWFATPDAFSPIPVRALRGAELEGARLEGWLSFPGQIKQALPNWRGAATTAIEDRDIHVIQSADATGFPVKLYFDDESGLLVRQVRYTDTPVGRNPVQIDYSDYREVAGVRLPFRWTVLWASGEAVVELTDVQPNAPIDAARFARPPGAP